MKRFFILLAAVGLSISAFSSSVSNATVLVQNTPAPKVVVPSGYKHYNYETDKKGVIMDYNFILPATNADAKAAVARMCAILNVNQQKLRSNDLESVFAASYSNLLRTYQENNEGEYDPEESVCYHRDSKIRPVCHTANNTLFTWSVEDEINFGGPHGMPYEYSMTFRQGETQPLGLKDVFKVASLPRVFQLISNKLRVKMAHTPAGYSRKAYLEDEPDEDTPIWTYEKYNGKFYPRLALTPRGISFTYQPYQKGSFDEGTVTVLLTWAEVKPLVNRTYVMQKY